MKISPFLAPTRGGSRTPATSNMERFVIIVNGWKPLAIITKSSILDVTAVLDPPLPTISYMHDIIWCGISHLQFLFYWKINIIKDKFSRHFVKESSLCYYKFSNFRMFYWKLNDLFVVFNVMIYCLYTNLYLSFQTRPRYW